MQHSIKQNLRQIPLPSQIIGISRGAFAPWVWSSFAKLNTKNHEQQKHDIDNIQNSTGKHTFVFFLFRRPTNTPQVTGKHCDATDLIVRPWGIGRTKTHTQDQSTYVGSKCSSDPARSKKNCHGSGLSKRCPDVSKPQNRHSKPTCWSQWEMWEQPLHFKYVAE